MDVNQIRRSKRDTGSGHKTTYHYLVNLYIVILRLIPLGSFFYCLIHGFMHFFQFPCPLIDNRPWLTLWPLAEILFFVSTLRKRHHLLGAFPKMGFRTVYERSELFYRCCSNVPALEKFLSVWFQGANLEELCRDDVKDFLAWSFLQKTVCSQHDDMELEPYLAHLESVLGKQFPPGRSRHQPMLLSVDPLQVQHKPLLYYLFVVGLSDFRSYMRLRLAGFEHYRLARSKSLSVFPWRPHTVLSRDISLSDHLSYFYRPHRQAGRRPVLFLHGFGLGMSRYADFLKDFDWYNGYSSAGVGIIALEIMPLTTRINEHDMLPMNQMVAEISSILSYHGWDEVTILAHSVGTVIAGQLLQQLGHTSIIGPMILVDPVAMTLHWGDMPFNMFYRQPRTAAERQLRYFFGADMTIAHSITTECTWQENQMWRSNIHDRVVTFIVSDDDLLVDSRTTMEFLTTSTEAAVDASNSLDVGLHPERYIAREPRAAILHEGIGHGEIFDSPKNWRVLKAILHQHCRLKDS